MHRLRVLFMTGLLFCLVNILYSQSSIIGLRFNNQSVTTAKLTVILPGNGGNRPEAKVGDQLPSGTKLIIPVNTIVLLQSPGGKQKISSSTNQPFSYTVEINGKGENHTIQGIGAQIQNSVTKAVGYNYKVNNGKGTTAASKGTEFTFTDLSEGKDEKATIKTTEGTIHIIDEVPCTINGQPVKNERKDEPVTKSVLRTQSAGDGEFTSSDEPLDYASLDAAVQYIQDEINDADTEPLVLADDLNCLGNLFMDAGRPADAVEAFSRAYDIYEEEYGPDDMPTLEARLYLAEALKATDEVANQSKGQKMAADMIDLLLEDLMFDKDDFQFAQQEDDEEAQQNICDDIIYTYELLGWAYDIAGNESQSDKYYDLMHKGCE
ncbi:MAG TPA: tetratricopeptide repeat protein [Panacibacter sp.]|mgnify:FL=1|nr:tetratricopeptide repeat protein [Panacibacter sp.]HNP45798.1 tetratricopeptide repeat protein [Panacibacter sp.]